MRFDDGGVCPTVDVRMQDRFYTQHVMTVHKIKHTGVHSELVNERGNKPVAAHCELACNYKQSQRVAALERSAYLLSFITDGPPPERHTPKKRRIAISRTEHQDDPPTLIEGSPGVFMTQHHIRHPRYSKPASRLSPAKLEADEFPLEALSQSKSITGYDSSPINATALLHPRPNRDGNSLYGRSALHNDEPNDLCHPDTSIRVQSAFSETAPGRVKVPSTPEHYMRRNHTPIDEHSRADISLPHRKKHHKEGFRDQGKQIDPPTQNRNEKLPSLGAFSADAKGQEFPESGIFPPGAETPRLENIPQTEVGSESGKQHRRTPKRNTKPILNVLTPTGSSPQFKARDKCEKSQNFRKATAQDRDEEPLEVFAEPEWKSDHYIDANSDRSAVKIIGLNNESFPEKDLIAERESARPDALDRKDGSVGSKGKLRQNESLDSDEGGVQTENLLPAVILVEIEIPNVDNIISKRDSAASATSVTESEIPNLVTITMKSDRPTSLTNLTESEIPNLDNLELKPHSADSATNVTESEIPNLDTIRMKPDCPDSVPNLVKSESSDLHDPGVSNQCQKDGKPVSVSSARRRDGIPQDGGPSSFDTIHEQKCTPETDANAIDVSGCGLVELDKNASQSHSGGSTSDLPTLFSHAQDHEPDSSQTPLPDDMTEVSALGINRVTAPRDPRSELEDGIGHSRLSAPGFFHSRLQTQDSRVYISTHEFPIPYRRSMTSYRPSVLHVESFVECDYLPQSKTEFDQGNRSGSRFVFEIDELEHMSLHPTEHGQLIQDIAALSKRFREADVRNGDVLEYRGLGRRIGFLDESRTIPMVQVGWHFDVSGIDRMMEAIPAGMSRQPELCESKQVVRTVRYV
jgi:hypothetical protein